MREIDHGLLVEKHSGLLVGKLLICYGKKCSKEKNLHKYSAVNIVLLSHVLLQCLKPISDSGCRND